MWFPLRQEIDVSSIFYFKMSSGRSPYPTRSRSRRLQQQQQQQQPQPQNQPSILLDDHAPPPNDFIRSSIGSTVSTSSFRLGQGLVQAKLSPAAINATSSSSTKKFFPYSGNHSTTTNPFSAGSAPPSTSSVTVPPTSSLTHPISQEHQKEEEVLVDGLPLTTIRSLAKSKTDTMSMFFAGIVYAKTQTKEDAYLYAQTLIENKETKRAVRLLESTGLLFGAGAENKALAMDATLLCAQALVSLEEWQTVLTLLEDNALYATFSTSNTTSNTFLASSSFSIDDDDDIAWLSLGQTIMEDFPSHKLHPLALLLNLRAMAYAKTGHPLRAATFWKKALKLDPRCVQALEGLLETTTESDGDDQSPFDLVNGLNFPPHFEFLKDFYLAKLQVTPFGNAASPKNSSNNDATPFWHEDASSIQMTSPRNNGNELSLSSSSIMMEDSSDNPKTSQALDNLWSTHKLQKSSQVLAMAAQRAYQNHDWKKALELCESLSQLDPLCPTAGFTYIATLVSLGKKRQLFALAHDWVDASPKSSKAWFAVGAYYYACGKYHVAQRHFCRSTRLDPHSPEAWIAFGTSFAMCDESDQALASFRAAQRLSPGDSTSLLYIGMEYLRTNHMVLANHFLQAAHQANPHNPLVCNELGVLYMTQPSSSTINDNANPDPQEKYQFAVEWFTKALALATNNSAAKSIQDLLQTATLDEYWEPTLFNLATALRKLRQLETAMECLSVCLSLKETSGAYAALGYCHHLMYLQRKEKNSEHIHLAIEQYHQSLSQKPDDPFCSEMLQRALSNALEESVFLGPQIERIDPQGRDSSKAIDQSSMIMSNEGEDSRFSFSVDQDSDVDMG